MIVCKHDTAVVVLSYNGKDLHHLFFPLLLSESQGHYDVVLVDNACTDDTASVVEQLFPEVSIVIKALPMDTMKASNKYKPNIMYS